MHINFPVTVSVFGTPMLLHGIMETLGIFIAFRYYLWLKRKQGDTIDKHSRLVALTAAILGAVAGSHLLGALEDVPRWIAYPGFWKYLYGNKTLVGGLVGGLILVELAKKWSGEKRPTGDLYTFPLLLGMISGRIGCFSTGVYEETYGVPTSLPWAMNLGDGIPRHPVALYEILFLLLLRAILSFVNRRYKLVPGALYKLFLMSYLLFRFMLDFIKPGWRYCLGLGSIQLTCLAGLIYYYRYILNPKLLLKTDAS